MEEENRRILEFAKQQQNREEDRMEKRKQAEEAMTKVQERVSIYCGGDDGVDGGDDGSDDGDDDGSDDDGDGSDDDGDDGGDDGDGTW
jgi:hypothetical protein